MQSTSTDNIRLPRKLRTEPWPGMPEPPVLPDDTVLHEQEPPQPESSQSEAPTLTPARDPMIHAVILHALAHNPEFKHYSATSEVFTDYLFATPLDEHTPEKIFQQLRWGGQFIFVSPSAKEVGETA